eukprot:170398_1
MASSRSRNWSQITAKQTISPSKKPSPQPSAIAKNRTRSRKNRKKRQKQGKQPWPTLNHSNKATPNQSPTKTNTNSKHNASSVSFAALTSKSQKFAPTSNPYDTLSVSSASSHRTNSTNNPSINQQELHKREQQRHSALNTLKKQWIHKDKDIFASHSNTIYGIKNRGISNRNVDCFINAIIQSLLSLPLLVSIFSTIKSAKTAATIGPFTKALYDTIHLFNIPHRHSSNTNTNNNATQKQINSINYNHTEYSTVHHPKSLISILDSFRYSMGRMGNGQQDAQEFLGYIVANLHDEMTWKINKKGNTAHSTCSLDSPKKDKQGKAKANMNDEEEKSSLGWQLVSKNVHCKTSIAHKLTMNESLISMLFGGEYYQMIRDGKKKSKPSVSYQPFFSISLDINEGKTRSVSSALQTHLSKPHVIEYKKGYANKSELVSEAPYYLLLHLKRFLFEDGHVYKVHKYVSYDTKLTIAPHLLFDKSSMKAGNVKKLRYELRSVIVHEGDFVTHGHYISYCRREDFYMKKVNKNRNHQWIMFNDGHVKGSIPVHTVKRQQAYVLVYQKIV